MQNPQAVIAKFGGISVVLWHTEEKPNTLDGAPQGISILDGDTYRAPTEREWRRIRLGRSPFAAQLSELPVF